MVPIRIPPAAPAQTRNIRRINMDLFRQDIQCANLCSMKGTCTEMWTQWHECLMSLVDQHAPLRPRKHRAHNVAPWYTPELAALVRRRNKLHRKWLRTRLDVDYRSFQQSRREVTRTSRALKEQHYNEAFVNATGNPRQTWRVLNQLSGRQPVHTLPKCSPDDIGNVFAGIVNDPQRPPALTLPQGPMSPNSLSIFKPVTVARVRKLLSSIAMTKATGSDGLPGTILKSCADLLAPSLMLIFNKSLSEGQQPPNMKIANITPVYKGGDPSQPTNYRPVSLLPIVSKLLERIVHEQLSQYLAEHNLYPSCQFGFRRQHSTEDALTMVTDKFLRARDDGLSTGAAFLDMSKAFDKVQHQTLVEDLFQLGISGTALNWLSDYLSNRQQQVVISGDSSSSFTCSSGVPQGSVLGPLLFVIYVRDVASEVDQFAVQVTQFADDIMLHDSRKDKVVLSHNLSSAITHLSNWLGISCLQLDSLANGKSRSSGVRYQDTVTYECNTGYFMVGHPTGTLTATCMATKTWSQPKPECQRIICEDPGQPTNGRYAHRGFEFGKTVRYTCNRGYEMPQGTLTVTCIGTGQWSQAKPTCQPRQCPAPGKPDSGQYRVARQGQYVSRPFQFGDTVLWFCNKGFTGNTRAVCQADGRWSKNTPTCTRIRCQDQGQLANGDSTSTGQQFGSTVRYRCHTGFYMVGSTSGVVTTRCLSDTRWSHDKPTCLPRTCPDPGSPTFGGFSVQMEIQRASLTPYLYNDTVTWTCDIGYSTTQPTTAVCQASGGWSNNHPDCKPRTCPDPVSPTFGGFSVQKGIRRASLTPYLYNDTVTWTCDIGYSTTQPTTAVCQANQTWSNNRPGCQRITCGNPGRPENGQATTNGIDYGKMRRYTCNTGFKMQNIASGVLTVTCTGTGQWSQPKPTCLPRQCPIPGTPTSGQYYVERLGQSLWKGPFQYADIVRWVCDTGFTGNTNAVCRADSTWSKNTPTCTRISCQDQGQLVNGDSTSTGQQFGSTVTYRCHTGFYMLGSRSGVATAQCMANKRWSHNKPTCLSRTCPDPVSPTFGGFSVQKGIRRASLTPYLYNDTVTWTCDIGYSTTQPTTAVCQANQTWSNNRPGCQRITCGDPGQLANGQVTSNGFDYGKITRYTCNTGFKMQNIPSGVLKVTCTGTGQWSQGKPTCLPINDYCEITQIHAPLYGRIEANSTQLNDMAYFQCVDGYDMNVTAKPVKCIVLNQTHGQWSDYTTPECFLPASIAIPQQDVTATISTHVTLRCQVVGTNITLSWQRTESSEHSWDELGYQITNKSNIHHNMTDSQLEISSVRRADGGTYTCSAWNPISRAQKSITLIVQARTCPDPGSPTSGSSSVRMGIQRASLTHYLYNDTVTWTCDIGYSTTEPTTAVCQASGGWSNNHPDCKRISCQDQGQLANGYSTSTGQQFGSTVTYQCHTGFYLLGSTSGVVTARCMSNKRWSHDKPTCLPRACHNPGRPTFGDFSVQMGIQRAHLTPYLYNDTVTWTCDIGYATTEPTTAVCQANQTWSNNRPGCQSITTIRPPSTRQISPQFTKERNTRAESTPTTVQLPTTSSHFDESEEYSSGLGQSPIIGISASVGTVLVISAIFCSVWWTSRMYTKRSCSGVSSDKEHQCSSKAGEGDGIYETVIGERLDQTDVPMTVEQSKEAADPMYESPANMSTTKISCVHTSNDAYATTSDML
ncbi:CUB and sushi domain-containing protein 1-like [Sycon ciliatum]|uniref:CUB and sushi domain-containing protein 1-like n=1 Tax=Sycon ciliatum TaxID=27933 RepID=UPI0031F6AFBF